MQLTNINHAREVSRCEIQNLTKPIYLSTSETASNAEQETKNAINVHIKIL